MTDTALNPSQVREVKTMAENIAREAVKEFFEEYLTEILPKQQATYIKLHDSDTQAHGGVARKFDRFVYIMIGVSIAGGGGIATAVQLLFGG